MDKKRIIWADSLKGWLILLVVLGHSIQTILGDACFENHLWNFIYSFHMPAFMAVSGYWAYKKNYSQRSDNILDYCKKRCLQLLIPYFIWSFLRVVVSGEYTLDAFSALLLHPDMYLWFLWVLFWISVLVEFMKWLSKRLHIDELALISVLCIIGVIIMVGLDFRLLGFQFLAYYMLFYTLGYCVKRYNLFIIKKNTISIVVLVWAILAWSWNMHELPTWFPVVSYIPSSVLQYFYRGLTAVLAVIALFSIALKYMDISNPINLRASEIGFYSLGIYAIHFFFLKPVTDLIKYVYPNISFELFVPISFLIITAFALLVVCLIKRSRIAGKFLLGKL